jgi:hypothetical protein
LRGQADADRGPGLDPLIPDDDTAHVKAVDSDIACRDRAEAANFVGAVKADGLVADARSECIVGRCDGILSGALRHCGSNEAAGGQQAHERVPQRRRRSSAVHGSSRNRRQKRVLGAASSHDGERS